MEVIGFARRKGEYQGVAYDNVVIYALRGSEPEKGETGRIAESLKIKTKDFDPEVCAVGNEIRPIYNRFGQVVDIEQMF